MRTILKIVWNCRDLVNDKLEEFRQQKSKYEALWEDNQQLTTMKRNVMILEQEKRELETRGAIHQCLRIILNSDS
jgi:hypothetical protein